MSPLNKIWMISTKSVFGLTSQFNFFIIYKKENDRREIQQNAKDC